MVSALSSMSVLLSSTEHLNEDTNEHQGDGDPLHASNWMVVHEDRCQDSEELSGGGHDTEDQWWEVGNSVEDKHLSEGTEDSQEDQIFNNEWVFHDELDESTHLEGWDGDSEADNTGPLVETLHLIPLVGVELLLDLTLSGSEETITEEGDEEGDESDDASATFTLVLLAIRGQVEEDNTSGDDETAEIVTFTVLALGTDDEGDNQDGDNLGCFMMAWTGNGT